MAGRPRFKPTPEERKQVEAMSGFGVPFAHISALIREGIDEDTLNRHFQRELKQGKAKANSKVGQTLFQKAVAGDTAAAIWWSKTQMGWKETIVTDKKVDHTSSDGSMTPKTVIFTRAEIEQQLIDAGIDPDKVKLDE